MEYRIREDQLDDLMIVVCSIKPQKPLAARVIKSIVDNVKDKPIK